MMQKTRPEEDLFSAFLSSASTNSARSVGVRTHKHNTNTASLVCVDQEKEKEKDGGKRIIKPMSRNAVVQVDLFSEFLGGGEEKNKGLVGRGTNDDAELIDGGELNQQMEINLASKHVDKRENQGEKVIVRKNSFDDFIDFDQEEDNALKIDVVKPKSNVLDSSFPSKKETKVPEKRVKDVSVVKESAPTTDLFDEWLRDEISQVDRTKEKVRPIIIEIPNIEPETNEKVTSQLVSQTINTENALKGFSGNLCLKSNDAQEITNEIALESFSEPLESKIYAFGDIHNEEATQSLVDQLKSKKDELDFEFNNRPLKDVLDDEKHAQTNSLLIAKDIKEVEFNWGFENDSGFHQNESVDITGHIDLNAFERKDLQVENVEFNWGCENDTDLNQNESVDVTGHFDFNSSERKDSQVNSLMSENIDVPRISESPNLLNGEFNASESSAVNAYLESSTVDMKEVLISEDSKIAVVAESSNLLIEDLKSNEKNDNFHLFLMKDYEPASQNSEAEVNCKKNVADGFESINSTKSTEIIPNALNVMEEVQDMDEHVFGSRELNNAHGSRVGFGESENSKLNRGNSQENSDGVLFESSIVLSNSENDFFEEVHHNCTTESVTEHQVLNEAPEKIFKVPDQDSSLNVKCDAILNFESDNWGWGIENDEGIQKQHTHNKDSESNEHKENPALDKDIKMENTLESEQSLKIEKNLKSRYDQLTNDFDPFDSFMEENLHYVPLKSEASQNRDNELNLVSSNIADVVCSRKSVPDVEHEVKVPKASETDFDPFDSFMEEELESLPKKKDVNDRSADIQFNVIRSSNTNMDGNYLGKGLNREIGFESYMDEEHHTEVKKLDHESEFDAFDSFMDESVRDKSDNIEQVNGFRKSTSNAGVENVKDLNISEFKSDEFEDLDYSAENRDVQYNNEVDHFDSYSEWLNLRDELEYMFDSIEHIDQWTKIEEISSIAFVHVNRVRFGIIESKNALLLSSFCEKLERESQSMTPALEFDSVYFSETFDILQTLNSQISNLESSSSSDIFLHFYPIAETLYSLFYNFLDNLCKQLVDNAHQIIDTRQLLLFFQHTISAIHTIKSSLPQMNNLHQQLSPESRKDTLLYWEHKHEWIHDHTDRLFSLTLSIFEWKYLLLIESQNQQL